MNFLLAVFFRQVWIQVYNPDGRTLSGKSQLLLCVIWHTSHTWTQRPLRVWAWNGGCWQKSFMLTGQINHGPKTRREPISVAHCIIEREALTFFYSLFWARGENLYPGRKRTPLTWLCSVNYCNWCVEAVWFKVLSCLVKHHHVNAGMGWLKFNIPLFCKVY